MTDAAARPSRAGGAETESGAGAGGADGAGGGEAGAIAPCDRALRVSALHTRAADWASRKRPMALSSRALAHDGTLVGDDIRGLGGLETVLLRVVMVHADTPAKAAEPISRILHSPKSWTGSALPPSDLFIILRPSSAPRFHQEMTNLFDTITRRTFPRRFGPKCRHSLSTIDERLATTGWGLVPPPGIPSMAALTIGPVSVGGRPFDHVILVRRQAADIGARLNVPGTDVEFTNFVPALRSVTLRWSAQRKRTRGYRHLCHGSLFAHSAKRFANRPSQMGASVR